MFDFSFYELVVFGIIALVVLGPEKLPQAVRTVGTYYAKFRRTVGTIKAEMEAELDLAETRQKMQEELAKIKQAEADMQKEMAQLRGSMKEFEKQQNSQLDPSDKASPTQPTDSNLTKVAPQGVTTNATVYLDSNNNNKTVKLKKDSPHTEHETENLDIHSRVGKDSVPSDESTIMTTAATLITTAHEAQLSSDTPSTTTRPSNAVKTRPWENMWFLLSGYDKANRLPNPPLLPDYTAYPLLYNSPSLSSSDSNSNNLPSTAANPITQNKGGKS